MKPLLKLEKIGHQLQKMPLKNFRMLLNALLCVLLAWLLAQLSWQLVPIPVSTETLVPPAARFTVNKNNQVDLTTLVSFSLFGKAEQTKTDKAAPVEVVTEAPKTKLNVKLTGLVAIGDAPDVGSAIIDSRGVEATYAIGDTIEGTNAVLKQVLYDRVLIQQAGAYETLMLDGMEYSKVTQANVGLGRSDDFSDEPPGLNAAPTVDMMAPVEVNDLLVEHREELMKEPMKFFDYIRVSPERDKGQLIGYKLTPGKDPALFAQLGLQAGDLAVEINGIRLDDMQQAMGAINELRNAQEASIKIERDGETRDILVNLSQ